MASTTFQDYNQNTPIVASWLNDVNAEVYTPTGIPKKALQSSAAWVRFSVVGGIVTIQQAQNISTVVRSSSGVYVVTYAAPLTNAVNCYEISTSQFGFIAFSAETSGSVTINTNNTSNVPADPSSVSLVVYGAN